MEYKLVEDHLIKVITTKKVLLKERNTRIRNYNIQEKTMKEEIVGSGTAFLK